VRDELAAARTEAARVVLDLREVEFLDSCGLRLIVEADRDAEKEGWTFVVVRPRDQVQRLLDVAGLSARLTVVDDPAEAADAPAARRRPAIDAAADAHPWTTLLGLAIVAGLGALDAHWGPDKVIIATVVIAPFITALAGSTRQTALVALAALLTCAVSGSWNGNYGTDDYFVRLLVVAAGGVFSLFGARTRERLAADRRRFEMLAGVAAITEAGASIAETVEQLDHLLVPAIADAAVLDVVRGGLPERLAVVVDGPRRKELEAALWQGTPRRRSTTRSRDCGRSACARASWSRCAPAHGGSAR
jgi:anti-anti-sigma factor